MSMSKAVISRIQPVFAQVATVVGAETRQALSATPAVADAERTAVGWLAGCSQIRSRCGVIAKLERERGFERTVFNYFPTKESLVLGRWESRLKSRRRSTRTGGPDVDRGVDRVHEHGGVATVAGQAVDGE